MTLVSLFAHWNIPEPNPTCRIERSASRTELFGMTNKTTTANRTKKQAKVVHPGMMGDGTEEQNLGQRGNPSARIKKKEVAAAFGKQRPTKK